MKCKYQISIFGFMFIWGVLMGQVSSPSAWPGKAMSIFVQTWEVYPQQKQVILSWYLPGSSIHDGSQPELLQNLLGSVFGAALPVGSKIPGGNLQVCHLILSHF
jgi:hypothetical protein